MDESNKKTVEAYSQSVDEYVNNTAKNRSTPINEWLDYSLSNLKFSSNIFEIGSAYGRDAVYIESLGYKVHRTDVVPGFVDLLKKQDPGASIFNALTDSIDQQYDLIIANAVFLHFTTEETRAVALKCLNALNPKGRLAISLKQGEGNEWVTKKGIGSRYFQYWMPYEIESLLYEVGFNNVYISLDESDKDRAIWIMVVAEKF